MNNTAKIFVHKSKHTSDTTHTHTRATKDILLQSVYVRHTTFSLLAKLMCEPYISTTFTCPCSVSVYGFGYFCYLQFVPKLYNTMQILNTYLNDSERPNTKE